MVEPERPNGWAFRLAGNENTYHADLSSVT